LGSYGYDRPTSPFLDSLARGGVVFEEATVNTHGTTPSHTTMLSGVYQQTHRVGFELTKHGLSYPIPPSVRLLQEYLVEEGYATVGFTDGGNAGRRFGFNRSFQHFDDQGGGIRKIRRRLNRFLESEDLSASPFFLFLHTYEVHSPYLPPAEDANEILRGDRTSDFHPISENLVPFVSSAGALPAGDLLRINDMYDAGIRHTDNVLSELFSDLRSRGLLENTFLIVTSDHGEEFGEHGGLLHRGLLYDELLRVPLFIVGPGVSPDRSRSMASTVDIAPTILSLLGLPPLPEHEGQNLLGGAEISVAMSQYGEDRYGITTSDWKLIETRPRGSELYDLNGDPGETINVAESHPDVVRRLRAILRSWLAEDRPTHETSEGEALSKEDADRLKALGYL